MSRPNLLLFMPDQLRADACGAFGNPVVHTPNLDLLADRGVTFTQAFAENSVCAQSRISMFTGWYPHVAGHRTLTNLLKPWEPNLLRILKDAGYHVAWAGARGDTFAPGVTRQSTSRFGFTTHPDPNSLARSVQLSEPPRPQAVGSLLHRSAPAPRRWPRRRRSHHRDRRSLARRATPRAVGPPGRALRPPSTLCRRRPLVFPPRSGPARTANAAGRTRQGPLRHRHPRALRHRPARRRRLGRDHRYLLRNGRPSR